MRVILWLGAVLFGAFLGIAFGRLAARLPIPGVVQSILAACAASIALPLTVLIPNEAVILTSLPLAVAMGLWDNIVLVLTCALMVAGLHAALGLSTRLAPRRPILLGILGGLIGVAAVGPAIERLNVSPARRIAADAVRQPRVPVSQQSQDLPLLSEIPLV